MLFDDDLRIQISVHDRMFHEITAVLEIKFKAYIEVIVKHRPSVTLSTTNPTWSDLGLNPDCRGGEPASVAVTLHTFAFRSCSVRVSAGTKVFLRFLVVFVQFLQAKNPVYYVDGGRTVSFASFIGNPTVPYYKTYNLTAPFNALRTSTHSLSERWSPNTTPDLPAVTCRTWSTQSRDHEASNPLGYNAV
jgi:hypothetical protein